MVSSKNFFYFLVLVLLFGGCSTKEVYKPKEVAGDWDKETSMPSEIVDVTAQVAQLEDGGVLVKSALIKSDLNEDERVLHVAQGKILSSTIDGNLTIREIKTAKRRSYDLKKTIATANVHGDLLAVLFATNEIALYDLNSGQPLLKEQGGAASVVDQRIVAPYFINDDLVIFATLDGKITIVNINAKKVLRSSIVSSEDNFNNIIYLSMMQNKIIAATGYKLMVMAQKQQRANYDIRAVVNDDKLIYVATKEGEIISLTPDLQRVKKIKLPFAHIMGMIQKDDKLYLLEREQYIIVVDKKTFTYKVYETDFSDGFAYVGQDHFYVDDTKIATE